MSSTVFIANVDFERIAPWWKLWADPKYRLLRDCYTQTPFRPRETLRAAGDLVRLSSDGLLFAGAGYETDGGSGPAIDTPATWRATMAVHDPLYDLLRDRDLSMLDRGICDELLRDVMLKDGAWPCRADYYLWGVRRFAARAAQPGLKQKKGEAPGV